MSLPRFDWSRDGRTSCVVKTLDKPAGVKLWQATNPDARDFRLEKLGPFGGAATLAREWPICRQAGETGKRLDRLLHRNDLPKWY